MNTDLTTLFQAVNALGVIGLLGFMVTAFLPRRSDRPVAPRKAMPSAVARRYAKHTDEAISIQLVNYRFKGGKDE